MSRANLGTGVSTQEKGVNHTLRGPPRERAREPTLATRMVGGEVAATRGLVGVVATAVARRMVGVAKGPEAAVQGEGSPQKPREDCEARNCQCLKHLCQT